jgi:hypothetical protein
MGRLFLIIALLGFFPSPARANELVNEDWVLKPGESRAEEFSTDGMTLTAEVRLVRHANKGVSVHVFDGSCWREKGCRSLPSWGHPPTWEFRRSERIPAGRWAFVVTNSQNLLERAVVHVRLSKQ